jgi:hypothetical protein
VSTQKSDLNHSLTVGMILTTGNKSKSTNQLPSTKIPSMPRKVVILTVMAVNLQNTLCYAGLGSVIDLKGSRRLTFEQMEPSSDSRRGS